MQFNNNKFELLRYGQDSTLKCCTSYCASTGDLIKQKDTVKDLGVLMSDTMDFNAHIDKVATSMKNMAGWILRTFKSREKILMLTTWKQLVLPIHDYCSQLYCPTRPGLIQKLEII